MLLALWVISEKEMLEALPLKPVKELPEVDDKSVFCKNNDLGDLHGLLLLLTFLLLTMLCLRGN